MKTEAKTGIQTKRFFVSKRLW